MNTKINIELVYKLHKEYEALKTECSVLKERIQEAFETDKVIYIGIYEKTLPESINEANDRLKGQGLDPFGNPFYFLSLIRMRDDEKPDFNEIDGINANGADAALVLSYIYELKAKRLKLLKDHLKGLGVLCN